MDSLGPNTNAPASVLSPDCILICGEDRSHIVPLLGDVTATHAFRSYEFWKQSHYTVILSGMGTGCVEPLIWELTRSPIVTRIVLIGTAGKMPGATIPIGDPRWISDAFLGGTALDGEGIPEPLHPRWNAPPNIALADSVSTDFFYGFGPRMTERGYPFNRGALQRKYDQHLARGTQLVDMEVAQFYAFCERFGNGRVQYVAIKGASNELGAETQQVAESAGIIARCLAVARQLLGEA